VDELAADIFYGSVFSGKSFLPSRPGRRSDVAPVNSLRALFSACLTNGFQRLDTRNSDASDVLQAFCDNSVVNWHMFDKSERWSVSRNGKIIEQSQILTTQKNLAPLFVALDLHNALSVRMLGKTPSAAFKWILSATDVKSSWKSPIFRMEKNSCLRMAADGVFSSLLVDFAKQSFCVSSFGARRPP